MICFETPSVKQLNKLKEKIGTEINIDNKDFIKLICSKEGKTLGIIDRNKKYILFEDLSLIQNKFFELKLKNIKTNK